MSSCTENEANHYGRFLCAILQILMRWHKDIKFFELVIFLLMIKQKKINLILF